MSPVVNKSTAPATTQAQPSNPTPPLASATAAHHRRRSRRHLPPSRRTTTPTPHPRHRRPPRTRIIVGCRATRQRPNHPAGHRPRQRLDPPTHSPTRPHHPARTGPPTPPRHRHRPTGHHHRSRGTPPPRLPQPTRPRHTRTHRRPHSTHRTHNRRTRTHPGRNGTPPRHTAPHRPSRSSGRHPQLRVPDNETDLLHHKTTEIHQAVLTTYPNHDIATVVDWMLLAAINALIAGDQSGANYHLAWAIAAISTRRSR